MTESPEWLPATLLMQARYRVECESVDQDWDAVAEAMTRRMTELGMRQQDLANKSGVGVSTIQEIQHNWKPRRRSPRTLASLSTALGWPAARLHSLATGNPEGDTEETGTDLVTELRQRLGDVERRLALMEGRIERIDARTSPEP